VLAGAGSYAALQALILRPGPLVQARDVVVPKGGVTEVGDALVRAGVIERVSTFRLAAWLSVGQGPLRALELEFPAHASLRTVLAVLRSGRPVQHLVTIPEGLTSRQIIALLNRGDALVGRIAVPPEGSVLPQTYAYEYGTARPALLARAEAAMAHELAAAWAKRAPGLPLASPADAVILASIVEKETAKPDERPHVAAVYLNRLRIGMRLQADPTVAYAVGGGNPLDRKLMRADLDFPSPYNTYRVGGLPPGPICSPGLASIQAVLHPAASDDLFFVADGTGGHIFSRTEEAHSRAVAAWRALNGSGSGHGSPD
jgi:UPF0755 protein